MVLTAMLAHSPLGWRAFPGVSRYLRYKVERRAKHAVLGEAVANMQKQIDIAGTEALPPYERRRRNRGCRSEVLA